MNGTPLRAISHDLDAFSVSIVVYRPDVTLLNRTEETLAAAIRGLGAPASQARSALYLIGNDASEELIEVPAAATLSSIRRC